MPSKTPKKPQHKLSGRFVPITAAGRRVKAFLPHPLPPRPPLDMNNLARACSEADMALAANPGLEGDHGTAAHTLLYLFERDEAIRCFRSG